MKNPAIEIRDDQQIVKQSNTLVRQAQSIVIKNEETCQTATEFAGKLKEFIQGPGTYHDDEIEMVNALKDRLLEKRHAIIDGPKEAYKIIKDKIGEYVSEQKRKRDEAIRKAEEAAREKERQKQAEIQAKIDAENARLRQIREEEQRKRDEAEAEILRQRNKAKREQLEKEEAERRKAEQERIALEREKAAEKKEMLEEKKEAVYVAPKVIEKKTPDNVSVSYAYEAVVTNKASIPLVYLEVNIALLERDQRAAKGSLKIPGVMFKQKAIGSMKI